MFSEYASKFLSKSQHAAPLFQGGVAPMDGSDTEAYLGWVGESIPSSAMSDDDTEDEPPDDLAVERPTHAPQDSAAHGMRNYPHWTESVRTWRPNQPGSISAAAAQRLPPTRGPSRVSAAAGGAPGAQFDDNSSNGQGADTETRPVPVDAAMFSQNALRSSALERAISTVYLACMATTLAAAIMVAFSTAPSRFGVYPLFARSARAIAVYTVLSILTAAAWLALILRKPRAVVQTSTVAVPTLVVSCGVYVFGSSFHPVSNHGWAHAGMRVSGLVCVGLAVIWVYVLRERKDALGKATEMIALAVTVLRACPFLLLLAIGVTGSAVVLVSLWILFLSRAALEGRIAIFLAIAFTFVYLWTWGIVCAIQKCIISGVALMWYKGYGLPYPATASTPESMRRSLILEALDEDKSGLLVFVGEVMFSRFGSCCASSLFALLIRVPLLVLPRSAIALIELGVRHIASAQVLALLDPLTLPTAVISQLPLHEAARKVASPEFVAAERRPYRLAKLLLAVARLTCALVVGFIAWVHADRIQSAASAYGYIVALMAMAVGWTVVGAAENTLSMLMDALFVCYILDSVPKNEAAGRVFGPLDQD